MSLNEFHSALNNFKEISEAKKRGGGKSAERRIQRAKQAAATKAAERSAKRGGPSVPGVEKSKNLAKPLADKSMKKFSKAMGAGGKSDKRRGETDKEYREPDKVVTNFNKRKRRGQYSGPVRKVKAGEPASKKFKGSDGKEFEIKAGDKVNLPSGPGARDKARSQADHIKQSKEKYGVTIRKKDLDNSGYDDEEGNPWHGAGGRFTSSQAAVGGKGSFSLRGVKLQPHGSTKSGSKDRMRRVKNPDCGRDVRGVAVGYKDGTSRAKYYEYPSDYKGEIRCNDGTVTVDATKGEKLKGRDKDDIGPEQSRGKRSPFEKMKRRFRAHDTKQGQWGRQSQDPEHRVTSTFDKINYKIRSPVTGKKMSVGDLNDKQHGDMAREEAKRRGYTVKQKDDGSYYAELRHRRGKAGAFDKQRQAADKRSMAGKEVTKERIAKKEKEIEKSSIDTSTKAGQKKVARKLKDTKSRLQKDFKKPDFLRRARETRDKMQSKGTRRE